MSHSYSWSAYGLAPSAKWAEWHPVAPNCWGYSSVDYAPVMHRRGFKTTISNERLGVWNHRWLDCLLTHCSGQHKEENVGVLREELSSNRCIPKNRPLTRNTFLCYDVMSQWTYLQDGYDSISLMIIQIHTKILFRTHPNSNKVVFLQVFTHGATWVLTWHVWEMYWSTTQLEWKHNKSHFCWVCLTSEICWMKWTPRAYFTKTGDVLTLRSHHSLSF